MEAEPSKQRLKRTKADPVAYGDYYAMDRAFMVSDPSKRHADHEFERYIGRLTYDELKTLLEDEYEESPG